MTHYPGRSTRSGDSPHLPGYRTKSLPHHAGIAAALVFALIAPLPNAQAASFGDAEIRSYLGQPIDVRIGVNTTDSDRLDESCFSLTQNTEPFSLRRDARLSVVDAAGVKSIRVRTTNGVNEPFVRLSLQYSCERVGSLTREYTLLLDPPPSIDRPVAGTVSSDPKPTVQPTQAQSASGNTVSQTNRQVGQWQAAATDTLDNIAEGVFPRSVKRKARYIAALRSLNPALANLADGSPIPAGTLLVLPDLRTLTSASRQVVPARGSASRGATQQVATRSATVSEPPLEVAPKVDRNVGVKTRAPQESRKAKSTAVQNAPRKPETEFFLRLSGPEVDVSRSENISEEARMLMRERKFLLDEDDQMAQFLALKNSVKQLESRLNEVQSKLANAPAPSIPSAPMRKNGENAAAVGSASEPSSLSLGWKPLGGASAWWLLGAFGVLAALVGGGVWRFKSRQVGRVKKSGLLSVEAAIAANAEETPMGQASFAAPPAASITTAEATTDGRAGEMTIAALQAAEDEIELARRKLAQSRNASSPADDSRKKAVDAAEPTIFTLDNDDFDKFDLDASPSMAVDFLLGDLDEPVKGFAEEDGLRSYAEERTRRLQYMQQRYPELLQNTISLDEPDSVINAARNYLEDATNADENVVGGRTATDKATELLSFALEERPQQMRYWLAQFEVFRIEGAGPAYAELASKFSVLFAQSPEWAQVKAIGQELAPTNPLFAQAPGSPISYLPTTSSERAENNWLNQLSTPADDARRDLAMLFRASLLSATGVSRTPESAGANSKE